MNIDAEWGLGKSFFLTEIGNSLSQNHIVITFNAWENDYSETPFESLICEIVDQLPTDSKFTGIKNKIIETASKIDLASITKMGLVIATGNRDFAEDASNVIKGITNPTENSILTRHREKKKAVQDFKKTLKELGVLISENSFKDRHPPIYILIDELDRCRPTFAVELLECIKHLFEIENIYFLIATNTRELSHTIRAIYGEKFDSQTYLNRFFHTYFSLSQPDISSFLAHLDTEKGIYDQLYTPKTTIEIRGRESITETKPIAFLTEIFGDLNLSLRDIEQCHTMMEACLLSKEDGDVKLHTILLGTLVALNLRHKEIYNSLRDKFDLTELRDFLKSKQRKASKTFAFSKFPNAEHPFPDGFQNFTLADLIFKYLNMISKAPADLKKESYAEDFQRQLQLELTHSHVNSSQLSAMNTATLGDYFNVAERSGHIKSIL